MRSRLLIICLLAASTLPFATGCSLYRQVSRPELWGLSLPESWEYDNLRNSGKSHFEARQMIWRSRQAPRAAPEHDTPEPQ